VTNFIAIGIPVLLTIFSGLLIHYSPNGDWKDIGKSLLTGSIVAFAIFALQFQLESERRDEEKEEQFRFSVGFAQDLTGLNPEFSLAGMYLSGKSLNKAELAGEELRETNLQGASLKGADMRGATLDRANLFGANLAGALTAKASFRHADLRGTRMHLASITLPVRPEDFVGARVNAKTCWPDDFLAELHSPEFARLRHVLRRDESRIHGRTLVGAGSDRAYGRACGLADENIWDSLGLYGSSNEVDVVGAEDLRQTAHGLAVTFGRSVPDLLSRFAGAKPMRMLGPAAPLIQPRFCAGARRIVAHFAGLTGQGSAGWLVKRPDQEPGKTLLIREPDGEPQDSYTILFQSGLAAGTTLTLIVEEPNRTEDPYRLRRQVRRCHAHIS